MPHDVTLLRDIALGIMFAAILGHVARLLRQPLLLGYIAGGILLSPQMGFGLITNPESIELISEIGLILLLFIIGLEIDLRELQRLGRSMLALGVGQFVINALLGLVFFSWLGYRVAVGLDEGLARTARWYETALADRELAGIVPQAVSGSD